MSRNLACVAVLLATAGCLNPAQVITVTVTPTSDSAVESIDTMHIWMVAYCDSNALSPNFQVTPIKDLGSKAPAGHPSAYNIPPFQGPGERCERSQDLLWPAPSTDPACTPDAIGIQVELFIDGSKRKDTVAAGPCGSDWVIYYGDLDGSGLKLNVSPIHPASCDRRGDGTKPGFVAEYGKRGCTNSTTQWTPGATTPVVGANADDAARTVTIANAPNNLKWSDFAPRGCTVVVRNSGGTTLDINDSSSHGPKVAAGDVISGCTTGQTLTITYKPTDGIAWGPHTFP